MKKNTAGNLWTMLILLPVILLVRLVDGLPWWSFVIPVILTGAILHVNKIRFSGFPAGFLCGFILWVGTNLYFDATRDSHILARLGLLLSLPKIAAILISGLIGGVMTGLALYTGKCIFSFENPVNI